MSSETVVEQHMPGCPMAGVPKVNRKKELRITYTGLKRLLNVAVNVSFSMRSGAGGLSISPSFAYRPTVDASTAPAFRMLRLLNNASKEMLLDPHDWQKLVASILTKIIGLFRAGKASPLAVDFENQSLLHYLALSVCRSPHVREVFTLISYDDASYAVLMRTSMQIAEIVNTRTLFYGRYRDHYLNPLLETVKCFVQYKVPTTEYDLSGG